jgi:dTDP-4-amino-4,6-dideoxygalactose transaminase
MGLQQPAQEAGFSLRQINHNYLPAQFADMEDIWAKIRETVQRGDFTLGRALGEFEEKCADYLKVKHVIGVNSGTDALILIMKAMGIRGEVIVPAFTFIATLGAVAMAGARPVLVDVGDDFCMDPDKIAAAATPHTEAILPVHWAGRPCDMIGIRYEAAKLGLPIIEDACHAMGAKFNGLFCGALGRAAAFSLHPLKNLNVWGDGGYISTDDDLLAGRLRLRETAKPGLDCDFKHQD